MILSKQQGGAVIMDQATLAADCILKSATSPCVYLFYFQSKIEKRERVLFIEDYWKQIILFQNKYISQKISEPYMIKYGH